MQAYTVDSPAPPDSNSVLWIPQRYQAGVVGLQRTSLSAYLAVRLLTARLTSSPAVEQRLEADALLPSRRKRDGVPAQPGAARWHAARAPVTTRWSLTPTRRGHLASSFHPIPSHAPNRLNPSRPTVMIGVGDEHRRHANDAHTCDIANTRQITAGPQAIVHAMRSRRHTRMPRAHVVWPRLRGDESSAPPLRFRRMWCCCCGFAKQAARGSHCRALGPYRDLLPHRTGGAAVAAGRSAITPR